MMMGRSLWRFPFIYLMKEYIIHEVKLKLRLREIVYSKKISVRGVYEVLWLVLNDCFTTLCRISRT